MTTPLPWRPAGPFTFIKIETLTDWLNDKTRSAEEHERIAEILSFVAERLNFASRGREGVTQEDIDHEVQVQKMLLVAEISQWWYQPEDVMIVTANDGTRVVRDRKYHGPQAYEASTPVTVKAALCLPEKTEEELKSSPEKEKSFASLDERFAPAEVQRRVARINAEAAELLRQRAEEDERRGFAG
jgi:hypothetical protein